MKKWIVLLMMLSLAIFAITGCDGVVPSEGEGEGEGEEEVKQVVLIELYIQDGCPACTVVEPILEQMTAQEYSKEEMILVELVPWGLYSIPEVKDRYEWYLPRKEDRVTPNTLYNGLQDRIYGSTNEGNIKTKLNALLTLTPVIRLEASRMADSEGTVITGKVKNIGSSELTDLVVNGMVFKDRNKQGFRYSVTDIFEDEKVIISSLSAGEEVDFTITVEGLNWDGENLDGVIFVQSVNHLKKVIRQSVFLD